MPQFWLSAICVALMLGATGFGLARLLLPAPLTYYHTSYLSLAIPSGWSCGRSGTAYTCGRTRPDLGPDAEPRPAIIIFTAKETGDSDSFELYRRHLETPRTLETTGPEGSPEGSIVESVSDAFIGGRRWIAGQHLHSEIPDYRTWYFATVAEDLSVLVTFSAHKDHSARYEAEVKTILGNLQLAKPVR